MPRDGFESFPFYEIYAKRGADLPVSALVLQASPFFAETPENVLSFAASHMELWSLRRREVLPPNGGPFAGFALVVQGTVQAVERTLDGREAPLVSASAGDVLGLAQLLADRPLLMHWVAVQGPATVAVLPRPRALEWLQMPTVALRAARWLAQQVNDMAAWQKFLAIHPVSARVCASLLHLMEPGGRLRLPTHAELGWRLNTTRETVTRVLQRLQQDGVVRRDGERWQVYQPDALRRLAQPESPT
jgi:CRP-like cAMP-binding protein